MPMKLLLLFVCFLFSLTNCNESSDDILVAQREGAANCTTTFRLKKGNKFIEKSICFGTTEVTGEYKIKNDTIFFENVKYSRLKNDFYQFALIQSPRFKKGSWELIRYKDVKDHQGQRLFISENKVSLLKE